MNTNQTKNITNIEKTSKINFYLLMNISLLLFLPLLSILFAHLIDKESINMQLVAKWFIFWAIGMRLFTAGIKQTSDPAFTGTKIFKITENDSYVVIRELGLANISLGAMGILSLINNEWRVLAAITGGLFFGFVTLVHSTRKPESKNEWIALMYDAMVFLLLIIYLAITFI